MKRRNFKDLLVFIAVANEQSFTRVAEQFGSTQSAISHSMKKLEEQMGVKLLNRTTRKVSLTDAGHKLLNECAPKLAAIEAELQAVSEFQSKVAGTIKITATDYAITSAINSKVANFLLDHPDVKIHFISDYTLSDIVANRYDAGIRFGESVAKDMISVRIGEDLRFALVASPAYLEDKVPPSVPQDLTSLDCINLRLPTHGGLYAWEFEKDGKEYKVRVNGQLIFDNIFQVAQAAIDGFGFCYVPEQLVSEQVAQGQLVRYLEDWCPLWSGYHLYYPSRRQPTRAMTLLVDALRVRGHAMGFDSASRS